MSDIRINGQQQAVAQVKYLAPDKPMDEAVKLLNDKKDGYDTVIGKLCGQDVLVVTQTAQRLAPHDRVTVDGHVVEVRAVENEYNAFGEGASGGMIALGGIVSFIGSAVALANSRVEKLPKAIGIPAVIVGLGLGTVAGALGLERLTRKSGDDTITDSISVPGVRCE